jgi:hypothetical protein
MAVWNTNPASAFASHRIMRKGFHMKNALSCTLALALVVTARAQAIAAEREAAIFDDYHYREPLSATKVWHKGRTVVIEDRRPDVIFLPISPYVIVTAPYE